MGSEKSLNILYLSYDGMTDPLGQSQVIPYLKGLCTTYRFWLISFEKEDNFLREGIKIREYLDHLGIHWHPCQYHRRPPVFSTVYDLFVMSHHARKLVRDKQIILVHCRSYPAGLIGLRLKKEFGIKYLFDIRGFWANERVDGGIWDLKNPIYKFIYKYFKKKESEMMGDADHIISLTYAGKEEIVSGRLFEYAHPSIPEQKVTVIPCAVDLELFDPKKITEKQRDDLRGHLGLATGEKVLCYLGSIGTWYLLDEMLSFFKEWKSKNPEYKFLFVTPDDPSIILGKALGIGLQETDLIIVRASRSEVPAHLSISDLGIFFIKSAYSKKASSATKMGEMMAMKVPVITNSGVGDGEVIVSEYKVGWLVNPNSDPDTSIVSDAKFDFDDVITYFSLDTGTESYFEVYRKMI